MIQATRNWFRRNRTNFAVGAGVLGAGYLAGQYVLGKITETRQRMSDDRIARENLRRRFEQNQEDCTFTVLAILPTATENILEALPVEQTVIELQQKKVDRSTKSVVASEGASSDLPSIAQSVTDDGDNKSLKSFQSESFIHASQVADSSASGDPTLQTPQAPKRTKIQLWNDMKISSIARAFTLIYTLALLSLLTRIQLNLLGRRNYLASVVSLASPSHQGPGINLENNDDDNFEHAYGNDFDTNRKYLSFSWWLLHKGCKDIMEKVVAAVTEVFGAENVRDDITLERLSHLTVSVRKKIEGATDADRKQQQKWLSYLLPPPTQEGFVLRESGMSSSEELTSTSPPLRRLLDETSDLISSPHFSHVLTLLLDSAFSLLIESKLSTLAFKVPPVSPSPARIQEIVDPASAKAKLAICLPVFAKEGKRIGSGDENEYLAGMEQVRELEAFAAVVYSSNFEFEVAEPIGGDGGETAGNTRPSTAGTMTAMREGPAVGAGISFESAWGKALNKEDGKS
ncbi:peroxin 3 [Aulographum hederae CBS 113979]|uniref:Peroxin 3 n=1 Tax=Aulographum hederae CBS 113979 TaxID=1176131 RepID=A0A6G1GRP1_9PEZI|nr:peroxin 3 [Aulographum hederae CBS 113979]